MKGQESKMIELGRKVGSIIVDETLNNIWIATATVLDGFLISVHFSRLYHSTIYVRSNKYAAIEYERRIC